MQELLVLKAATTRAETLNLFPGHSSSFGSLTKPFVFSSIYFSQSFGLLHFGLSGDGALLLQSPRHPRDVFYKT